MLNLPHRRDLLALVLLSASLSGVLVPGLCAQETVGPSWSDVGGGTSGRVSALGFVGSPGAQELIAGGGFNVAGGLSVGSLARWDGSSWDDLQGGVTKGDTSGYGWGPTVLALKSYDDALYVGGSFFEAGGEPVRHLASLKNGSAWTKGATLSFLNRSMPWLQPEVWSDVGGGVSDLTNVFLHVSDMVVHDDGSGRMLYVAGEFTSPGDGIARWNGSTWIPIPGATLFQGTAPAYASIHSLAVFDDGTQRVLVACGHWDEIGGVVTGDLALWDGSCWSPMGNGIKVAGLSSAMVQFDDGSGPALYVTGDIALSLPGGGYQQVNIARWDGATWSAVGGGLDDVGNALVVHDDGSGPALYVGGYFSQAGGIPAERLARWDGSSWSEVGGGLTANDVQALASRPGCLAVGGSFTEAGGLPVSNIALWGTACD